MDKINQKLGEVCVDEKEQDKVVFDFLKIQVEFLKRSHSETIENDPWTFYKDKDGYY